MLGRLVHLVNNLPLWFFIRRAHTILDVGCGRTSPITYFTTRQQQLDGLDIATIAFTQRSLAPYRRVITGDFRVYAGTQRYDVITALDFIEHVTKDDGTMMLEKMEKMADRVIIVTPNGYRPQAPALHNPWQQHLSGWTREDFLARGYKVYGMFGPKWLRTGPAVLRFRPKIFWGAAVWLLTPLFFCLPRYAFSLLAIYDKR